MTVPRPIKKKFQGIKWQEQQEGKLVTPSNVWQDIKESAYDFRDEPEEFDKRVRQRLSDYQNKGGPDINQPVPIPDPYQKRRK